ncbi:MAG TPA: Nif3-like dinuclear metal center hexameric protein [Planctomycetota bacterium]|nr:Nif3-like dinuclear metal center hexameric protein [Planctomycetota bacterium]HRR82870.1 Nif3-like dinuclear metal center hexameric protein [Planctomycetota bacterium]HRT97149.1 Nif3-like dinuclear metal center hexameric protein [Planctomycetota bacterium]
MTPSVATVVEALHTIAPPSLAESWDNVGLIAGDPAAPCRRVLVCLDVDAALVRRAARAGAQLIVSHHPPLFAPLHKITADTPSGSLLLGAARAGVALAAAHTNYDVAPGGVNDVLADLLDLRAVEPLTRAESSAQAKLVVFTPAADLEAVIRALSAAGAGVIGQYRDCTFRTPGTGTFRGLAHSCPTVGQAGRFEEVPEFRLEAVVPLALAERAIAAARAAHSYEEPAIDLYPLAGGRLDLGLGRCGDLARECPARRLVRRIRQRLRVTSVRTAGDLRRTVRRVAVLGGSGGKCVDDAVRRGCQLYLTGEVSHHQALAAEAAGLVLVDAGHAGTEAPAIPVLARRLSELCPGVHFTPVGLKAQGPLQPC